MPNVFVQAVLFDYGLVLSGPPDPAAWAEMQAITGLPEAELHGAYWAPRHAYDRGTHTGRQYWAVVGTHAGLNLLPNQIDALIEADTALWTQVNQPMVDWAARLQAAGTPTGILSNLGDAMTAGVLARHPWLLAFNHRLWSHTLKLAKPELEIYRHAALGLAVPESKILFVDDREDNIAAARAAGMQAVRYQDQAGFERELAELGLEDLWKTGRIPVPGPAEKITSIT